MNLRPMEMRDNPAARRSSFELAGIWAWQTWNCLLWFSSRSFGRLSTSREGSLLCSRKTKGSWLAVVALLCPIRLLNYKNCMSLKIVISSYSSRLIKLDIPGSLPSRLWTALSRNLYWAGYGCGIYQHYGFTALQQPLSNAVYPAMNIWI